MDKKAEEFLEVGCGAPKESFITRLESYACSGVRSLVHANNAKRTLDMRGQLREIARSSLREISSFRC